MCDTLPEKGARRQGTRPWPPALPGEPPIPPDDHWTVIVDNSPRRPGRPR